MLEFFVKILSEIITGYSTGKKELFKNHIDPLKEKLDTVHKEYVNSFLFIKDSLARKEVPIDELLNFLETKRQDRLHERDLVKQLADALGSAERHLIPPATFSAIQDFSNAIAGYFNVSNSVASNSWYSEFIRYMKISREHHTEQEFFDTNLFGNDPRRDLVEKLTFILDEGLPSAMTKVNKSYAALRTALI